MGTRHIGRHGNDRRFLYKGIWVRVFSEWHPETWNALYTRAETKEHHELRGKYQARSRKELFQNIRYALTMDLNPDLGKVTDRLMGKKDDSTNLTIEKLRAVKKAFDQRKEEKFKEMLANPFGDKL